jgi:putative PEP-CTERM system TPR-repeat lipoprotein
MRCVKKSRFVAAYLAAWAVCVISGVAYSSDADDYLQSAHKLEQANDLRGAEIQLRNAAAAEPGNSAIRLELARVYLELGNPNAAEAELFAAHWRGANEATAAPLMAQAMLEMGQLGDLLKNIPAGHRPPKLESQVRSYRGMAALGLGDLKTANAMFADATRLDPKSPIPLTGQARVLLQQRQYRPAQQVADKALQLDPRNANAIEVKALSLAAAGDFDTALRQLGSAIRANPNNFRALLDRANLELQHGKMALAEKDIAAARKAAPGSAIALLLQGFVDAQKGNYREADRIFDKLRGIMTNVPATYLIAAQVKVKLGQTEQAEAYLKKFLAQAGDQPKAYEMLGVIALKRNNYESAIASLEKANRLAPSDTEILGILGQAYVAHGDMDKAKIVFDQAASRAPGDASLATRQALVDFASGDREAGLTKLKNVFKGGKGNISAGPPLVLEALQSGRVDDAEDAAQALVAHDPNDVAYQELMAAVKMAKRDFGGAESLLRRLLQKNPDLPSARRDLAQVYMLTNRAALAKKLYQDRLAAKPSDVSSMEALANIALQQKDDRSALQWLTQAQARAPSDPKPSLQMIAVLAARKQWPDALPRAQALQRKFNKDASVQDALAQVYFQSGNRAASLAAYREGVAKFRTSAILFAHYAGVLAAQKNFSGAAAAALQAARLDPRSVDLKRAYVSLSYRAAGPAGVLAASQKVFSEPTTATLVAADVLEANNNRPAAIALLEKDQDHNQTALTVSRLAVLYQRDNKPAKGIALLETWTKQHPADIQPQSVLAQLYSSSGRTADATKQYEWLAVRQPDNPTVLNNLAWLYSVKHDSRAKQVAEKALGLAPASGSIADTLGWILVNEGQIGDAIKYLQRASASMPGDQTIQYHYAVALSKTGKAEQARAVLEKTLQSKTGSGMPEARALLASLKAAH